jgi:phage/plasmid-like protein (TIGR03299 family)
MSRETMEWLNLNTLIGFTDVRGNAWHYRQELQGLESNHYSGAVPVEDVLRRLFYWEAIEAEMLYKFKGTLLQAPGRKIIIRNDDGRVLGAFKEGYKIHQPAEWLLENVGVILDDDLGIGSAGLLKGGAVQWVSVEVPENIVTPEGVEFRPNLLATGSCDGSIATTYKRVNTLVVCDNTREMALGEEGQQFKVRHTKNSGYRIRDAREALAIVHTMADDFVKEVAALTSWKVSDAEFLRHLQVMIPVNDEMSKVGITKSENKRAEITQLYNFDNRVAPWKGTAYGVAMAYNTWGQHFRNVRKGVPRSVRNMESLVSGKTANEDAQVLTVLSDVTSTPVPVAIA